MTSPNELHKRPIHLVNGPLPVSLSLGRFLVTWRDAVTQQDQALGNLACPSAVDDVDDTAAANAATRKPELFLRLAWDAAGGGLLLYFYLPLKMRAAARGRRDVYLVVPAEGIEKWDVDGGVPGAGERSGATADGEERGAGSCGNDAEREGHGEKGEQTAASSERANVDVVVRLRLRLRLRVALSRSCSVLMPTAGAKRPLSTQSRGLLLSLKSLALAPDFEVALPRSPRLERVLREVAACDKGALRTPRIDHEKTFSGREWAEAPWERYLLREGERLEVPWNPVLDEAPPAYEDVVGGAEDARCGLEVGERREEEEEEEVDGQGAVMFKEVVLGVAGEQGGLALDISKAYEPAQQTTASLHPVVKHKAAPAIQGNTQQTTGSVRPTLKRKAASPPPPPPPPAHSHAPQPTRTAYPAIPITTSALFHTLHAHLSPTSPPGALASQLPLPPHSQSVLHLGRSRTLFNDAQYARFFNGVAWLATLWPRRPDAHLVLLPQCGRLMQCVRSDDAMRFVEQRVEAMAAALALAGEQKDKDDRRDDDAKRQKKSERLGTRNPFDGPPSQAAARLVEFVYVWIGEGVDNFVVDDLLALQQIAGLLERAAAAAGLCGGGDDNERTGLHLALERASDDAVFELERQAVAFTFQMAACVMLALFKAHERDWFVVGAPANVTA